jgi:hypothetical protein
MLRVSVVTCYLVSPKSLRRCVYNCRFVYSQGGGDVDGTRRAANAKGQSGLCAGTVGETEPEQRVAKCKANITVFHAEVISAAAGEGFSAVWSQQRRTSATRQACATQPRGFRGGCEEPFGRFVGLAVEVRLDCIVRQRGALLAYRWDWLSPASRE